MLTAPSETERAGAAATAPAPHSVRNNSKSNSTRVADSTQASPEAVAAARDVAFEAIVQNASLGESYARSLAEAAWRGDKVTVETHIRQWRSCLHATIDAFKALNIAEARAA